MIKKRAALLGCIAAIIVSAAGPASADVFSLKAGVTYFLPSESSLKSIYGNGIGWNAEMNIGILPVLDLWAFGTTYNKKGRLPVTGESTEMRLITFGGGIKVRAAAGSLRVYAGAGAAACAYRESNVIGLAEGTKVGAVGQVGMSIPIIAGLLIDFAADYSSVKVKPAAIQADLGGTRLSARIGYVF